ncbi:MAG: serine--tRNA ligase [Oscillospiraceae bacterium]
MLDIKSIRENPEEIKTRLKVRSKNYDDGIDEIVEIDKQRRLKTAELDSLKAQQNAASKQIPQIKKSGGDVSEIMAEMKEIADKAKIDGAALVELEERQKAILYSIPNTPHSSVPYGTDSDDNIEMRHWGEPTNFSFTAKPHWELGSDLGILDPERAAKVTGARFHFYKGLGARLERSIYNFYLDLHSGEHGYTEIFPPYLANRASMTATGQLPKFEEDMFKIEGLDYYLIPTAEVPVTNLYRDEILNGADLPIKYCAYSACFRAEAGSAGRDTRGLIRQHQFNKVELVKFANPETSYEELEKLTHDAEHALQLLGLPYRVVTLCGGDLGFSSAKTYDIEVWLPSYGRYAEISSCSNFEDFQARRASIRYRDEDGKVRLVHTLNGSGLAVGRTTAAILENFQNADGSVTVPDVLVPYMGGVTVIK